VFKAKTIDKETKKEKVLAIKKFRLFEQGISITTMREIKFLKKVDHPNCVKLHEVKATRPSKSESNKNNGSMYLIFDFLNNDL
jgi:serine/threonine protein kinase